ncbi:hypothetical protein [Pedobacter helvus]|uniref:Lipoprotein n=1 Tax=Pedobacter helvus TaxID=2563444 RepID=A0ABW9JE11_9SPHI|nr:hypothetical protein [Pedobacter ureilyticus]
MKNFILKPLLLLLSIFGFAQSCQKTENTIELQKCDLTAKEILTVENKTATLIYTNKLGSIDVPDAGYFIVNHNLSQTYNLPLMVCNFPIEKYPSLKIGESMKVDFSGRIEILPETADAFCTKIELTKISKVDESKN